MWEPNEEDGVKYVVSPNGWKFEYTKDGDLFDVSGGAGGSVSGKKLWNFSCDEEGFTSNLEKDGEELEDVDAGDGEVNADEYVDVEEERGEGTNVNCEEESGDVEEGDACGGEGDEDEGEGE